MNRHRERSVLLALCLAVLPSLCAGQALYPEMGERIATLVEGGQAKCSIVVADPKAQKPAEELAAYIEKISGAKPPIVTDAQSTTGFRIRVGGKALDDGAWQSLPGDGYVIKGSADELILTGKTELGIFYAVDTFLEKCLAVRWFMPGDIGEAVPKADTIRIGKLDEIGRPAFRMRWVGSGEWARRNKMNVGVKCDGEFKIKWFVHTFTQILPPEKYYADHPEYYALIGGKRVNKKDPRDQIQICTSNPDVVSEVAANVVKLKDEDPTINMISVDPMDTQRFCECENCAALDEAGTEMNNSMTRRLLTFYNAVSDLVGQKHPGLFLKSIAYHKYVAPPLDPKLRVNDNCVIQFCRFTCHNHALNDASCPYNREFNKYIFGWLKIAKNVSLYEYYFKASWVELPWPIVHMLRADIPYFHKLKLFGLATQYRHNFGSNGLDYYVAAKLLWDPTLNVDALLDDFYTRCYAEASRPMRTYYETLEGAAIASGVHLARQRPYAEIIKLFTPELLARLDQCISEAEKAVLEEKVEGPPPKPPVDEKVRARIELVRTSLEYAKACSEYVRALERLRQESRTPWITLATLDRAEALGGPHIEKIKSILDKGSKIGATGGPEDSYVALLLSPKGVLRYWDAPELGFGERTKTTQKKDWLAKPGRKPGPASRPEKFAVWFFGNDFDCDGEKSEHEVWIVKPSGEKVKIGALAPVGSPGDGVDKCYLIGGMSTAEIIGHKATIILTNPSGEWTGSTVFAVYLMPDEPGISSEDATKRITESLDAVRSSALGFVEAAGQGMVNRDGEELKLDIDVTR